MAWTDRLRKFATFTSPSGLKFTPLWKSNEISAEKRLGRHAYPNLDREIVQDMGMNCREVPLTVYFDGPEHDKLAREFELALFELGVWDVIHPVYGIFNLQLVSYKLVADPIESGNVTEFITEWIEPVSDEEIFSLPDLTSTAEAAIETVKIATVEDMATIKQNTVSQAKAIATAIRQGVTTIKGAIRSTNAQVNSLQAKINDLIMSPYLDIVSISGGIIDLIHAPGLMINSLSSKMAMFGNLGRKTIDNLPSSARTDQINSAMIGQLFLNAITTATSEAIISGEPETRREALSTLSAYQQFNKESQDALEQIAVETRDNKIEEQFIVRSCSGEAVSTLNTAVTQYLMHASFNLKIERRIILNRPRSPMDIAINEYKASGETADYYYKIFCKTNNLHGKELLLLQPGREVVIYG